MTHSITGTTNPDGPVYIPTMPSVMFERLWKAFKTQSSHQGSFEPHKPMIPAVLLNYFDIIDHWEPISVGGNSNLNDQRMMDFFECTRDSGVEVILDNGYAEGHENPDVTETVRTLELVGCNIVVTDEDPQDPIESVRSFIHEFRILSPWVGSEDQRIHYLIPVHQKDPDDLYTLVYDVVDFLRPTEAPIWGIPKSHEDDREIIVDHLTWALKYCKFDNLSKHIHLLGCYNLADDQELIRDIPTGYRVTYDTTWPVYVEAHEVMEGQPPRVVEKLHSIDTWNELVAWGKEMSYEQALRMLTRLRELEIRYKEIRGLY